MKGFLFEFLATLNITSLREVIEKTYPSNQLLYCGQTNQTLDKILAVIFFKYNITVIYSVPFIEDKIIYKKKICFNKKDFNYL